ncbi:MAG TPA: hypothetical protein VFE51_08585 [Verrucomicrobiae bacterium]|nr:hypothetical protein [Verrucomicrobiae bacterium]
MDITNLSPQQLRQAAALQERILELQDQLNEILGGEIPVPFVTEAPQAPRKGRRKMSAEGRARIVAAQKARWAKARRKSGDKQASDSATKPKRKMSAAAKAKISAAAKARWKKAKAAGKSRL